VESPPAPGLVAAPARDGARPEPTSDEPRIRLLIIAGIRLYREGLRDTLQGRSGLEVVGTAADARDALAAVRERAPAVALVDLDIPSICRFVSVVAERAPSVKVVALGMVEENEDVLACVEAGIAGYVPRDGSVEELVSRVRSAARGELTLSPQLAAGLARRVVLLAGALRASQPQPALTGREREIAGLLNDGLTNKQIAQQLCIEVPTVKNHVHNILEKLQVHRRGEAAAAMRRSALSRLPVE
jgi:two-component system, NarL family, nitrate/nitrite response regulator NarL